MSIVRKTIRVIAYGFGGLFAIATVANLVEGPELRQAKAFCSKFPGVVRVMVDKPQPNPGMGGALFEMPSIPVCLNEVDLPINFMRPEQLAEMTAAAKAAKQAGIDPRTGFPSLSR